MAYLGFCKGGAHELFCLFVSHKRVASRSANAFFAATTNSPHCKNKRLYAEGLSAMSLPPKYANGNAYTMQKARRYIMSWPYSEVSIA